MRLQKRAGFTLVELIVVLAILGIVSLAISSVFQFSLRSFTSSNLRSKQQYETRTAMDQVKKELSVSAAAIIYEVIPTSKPVNSGYGYCYYDSSNHYLVLHTPAGKDYTLLNYLPDSLAASINFAPVTRFVDGDDITNAVELIWQVGDYKLNTVVYVPNAVKPIYNMEVANVSAQFDLVDNDGVFTGIYLEYK